MITIINVELRLKTRFVWFRLVSFRNGFVWFRFAKYSKPLGDTYKLQVENRDPRKLTSVRVFNIHCKPFTLSLVLVSSQ